MIVNSLHQVSKPASYVNASAWKKNILVPSCENSAILKQNNLLSLTFVINLYIQS